MTPSVERNFRRKAAIQALAKVLREWKRHTDQIDNGNCTICLTPGRYFRFVGTRAIPKPCPNERCFSRKVDAALRQARRALAR